ncbi:MAG: penicillin-binding protein 2 [Candidatus Berkelbacteria bacterium]
MYKQPRTTDGRVKVLNIIVLALAGIFCFRLFDLQVTQNSHYVALAQSQQQFEKTQIAHRGEIYVHDSVSDPTAYYPLAFDIKKYSILVVPMQVVDKLNLSKELAPLLGLNQMDIYGKINNNKSYIPPLKTGMTYEEAKVVNDKHFQGLLIVPVYSRFYPESQLASQLLGFVNADGEGNYGIEGKYNDVLKGKDGSITGEKDTYGRIISMLSQRAPENGTSYVLTIDRSVQYFVEKTLAAGIEKYGAKSGSVIVMDVKTGGILAMASNPSFDPNNYSKTATENASLFINPVTSMVYEPGSTMKPLVMAGAIEQGIVTPETKGTFAESVKVGQYTIETAERKAFGEETMTQVLENSDNVAMVWLSEQMGSEMMYKYLDAFGLMEKTGTQLNNEVAGTIPLLKNWRDINRATISFGQGASVTPMQLLTAYSAFANKGVIIEPHIIDKTIYSNGEVKQAVREEGKRAITEETAGKVLRMLQAVTEHGSAMAARVPGFNIGAKSGTAQVPDPKGGYDTKKSIHSLAGVAPTEDPRFVMLVKIDEPTSARFSSSTASPLFGQIASFLLNYYYRLTPIN